MDNQTYGKKLHVGVTLKEYKMQSDDEYTHCGELEPAEHEWTCKDHDFKDIWDAGLTK